MKLGEIIINLPGGNYDRAACSFIDKGGIHAPSIIAQDAKRRNLVGAKKILPILKEAFIFNGKSAVKYEEWVKSIVKDELGVSGRDRLSFNSFSYTSYSECKRALKGI